MQFRLDYDPARNRILAEVRGFWTLDTVRDFAAAAGAKAQEVRASRVDYDLLVDSREFPVQAHDVADLLASIADAALSLTSGRAASVVGSHPDEPAARHLHDNGRCRGLAGGTPLIVIPAKAGISCGSCPARSPEIPAFGGMTYWVGEP
jgi:hypothetical protein